MLHSAFSFFFFLGGGFGGVVVCTTYLFYGLWRHCGVTKGISIVYSNVISQNFLGVAGEAFMAWITNAIINFLGLF